MSGDNDLRRGGDSVFEGIGYEEDESRKKAASERKREREKEKERERDTKKEPVIRGWEVSERRHASTKWDWILTV